MSSIEFQGLGHLDLLDICDSLIAVKHLLTENMDLDRYATLSRQTIIEAARFWIGETSAGPAASQFSSGIYANLVYHVTLQLRYQRQSLPRRSAINPAI